MREEPLVSRSCRPCRGGVAPLGAEEAERYRAETPDWSIAADATRLDRHFTFKTYGQAFDLVRRISALAEAEGHHPDIRFGWGYCDVSLQTHVIGGLHLNDFILAAKIDGLAG